VSCIEQLLRFADSCPDSDAPVLLELTSKLLDHKKFQDAKMGMLLQKLFPAVAEVTKCDELVKQLVEKIPTWEGGKGVRIKWLTTASSHGLTDRNTNSGGYE
jgi:hypothetical protein